MTGCSGPHLTSNNSTSLIYRCIGGSENQTIGVYWKVNSNTSSYSHIDTHDNRNYISEVTIPIELNGALLECCFIPQVGDSDICCSVIVNIGMYFTALIVMIMSIIIIIIIIINDYITLDIITRTIDPGSEPTTVPTELPTSTYDLDTSSLFTATPCK